MVKGEQTALWAESAGVVLEAHASAPEPQKSTRKKAQTDLSALSAVELGLRRSAARNYLLTAHPDFSRFHQMLDEGRYDEFTRECEKQLLAGI